MGRALFLALFGPASVLARLLGCRIFFVLQRAFKPTKGADMMFSVSKDGSSISRVSSSWAPRELDLERFILNGPGSEEGLLNESVFGEELLLVSNQVRTREQKRADILALDRHGSGVIIELKRDQAMAGVETQALQYLAAFAPYRGLEFTRQFGREPELLSVPNDESHGKLHPMRFL